ACCEVVDVRHRLLAGVSVVVEAERSTGELRGDRTPRTFGVFLDLLRSRSPRGLCVGTEVPVPRRLRSTRIEAMAAKASAGPRAATPPAGRWPPEAPAWSRRPAGSPVLTGPRFADREGTPVERHAVEFLNRLLSVPAILELDECEAARPARLAIDGQHNLRR